MMRRIITHPTFRQMVRYAVVGCTTLVFDFGIYLGLTRGMPWFKSHYLVANMIAVALALGWNFLFNLRWTFRQTGIGSIPQYVSFSAVAAAGFGWNQLLLWIAVSRFGLHDIAAKAAAIVIVFFWNFFVQRAVTFGLVATVVERKRTVYTNTSS